MEGLATNNRKDKRDLFECVDLSYTTSDIESQVFYFYIWETRKDTIKNTAQYSLHYFTSWK